MFSLIFFLVLALNPEPASEWNALTAQTSGWLAADGVYSVRELKTGDVYFLFSDTICGTTRESGREFGDVYMVNHSFWRVPAQGPMECFVPPKGQNLLPGRYWLQDAVFLDGKLKFTAMIPEKKTWKPMQIDWVSLPIKSDGTPDFANAQIQKNVPLLRETPDSWFVFGAAICDDAQDGFFYIFGYADRKGLHRKDLIAARVRPDKLEDFSAWRFWNGRGWGKEMTESASLAERVSCELSVSRLPSGKFLLVYTRDCISRTVEYRLADRPFGPFSEPKVLYEIPPLPEGISAYNAKAHPALSTDEELVFTYNVNRLGSLPHKPEEYRPVFMRVRIEDL